MLFRSVIVVASAAPAFAASTPKTLTFNRGTSAVVPDPDFPIYDNFQFAGASVATAGGAIAAGAFQMVVTFVGTTSNVGTPFLFVNTAITGFTGSTAPGNAANTLTYTRNAAVPAGGSVTIPNGQPFGCTTERLGQQGTFIITFNAPGFTSSLPASFATIPATAPARGQGPAKKRA